jgi:hypothetical protein
MLVSNCPERRFDNLFLVQDRADVGQQDLASQAAEITLNSQIFYCLFLSVDFL